MPDLARKIVYLTEAQHETLVTNGTITVGNVTVTYNPNDIYVTPSPGIATVLETEEIINEYEEDEGMVVETVFVTDQNSGTAYFETILDATDIVAAFKSGKNIVFHLPETEGMGAYGALPGYLQAVAYSDAYEYDVYSYPAGFCLAQISIYPDGEGYSPSNSLYRTHVGENGKIQLGVNTD